MKNITKTIYKVNDFLSWKKSKSLILSPSFQRRPVWPKAAKSFLLDTVVKGLPIPIIFIREKTDIKSLEPIREVVDGQQRLRTLISYIAPNLLEDFEVNRDTFTIMKSHNDKLSNKLFVNLAEEDRKNILNYEFSVHVLPSDTEDREILQIFARMNSTGVKLNNQELRNAKYFGEFKNLCYLLAYEQLDRWRNWDIFSEMDIARMNEVEETSDYLCLMIKGLHGKSQSTLDRLYEKYENTLPIKPKLQKRFRNVMDKIDDVIGNEIKKTEFRRKVLFGSLFTFFYSKMYGLKSILNKQTPKSIPSKIKLIINITSDRIERMVI